MNCAMCPSWMGGGMFLGTVIGRVCQVVEKSERAVIRPLITN